MPAFRPTTTPDPRLILAETTRYRIWHDHETAYLHRKGSLRADVVIGDFYGNPQTAYIAPDESYCAVAGCGLILYYLRLPFEEYRPDQASPSWWEWGRTPDDIYWIETLYSPDPASEVRFVVEPLDDTRRGVYRLLLATLTVEKLL